MAALHAAIAQLGERQTEDLKVTGSIPVGGIFFQRVLTIFSYFTFLVVSHILNVPDHLFLPFQIIFYFSSKNCR